MLKNLKEPEVFLHRILLEETDQPWERTGIRGKREKVAESRDRLQEEKSRMVRPDISRAALLHRR
jgi:hypothetical protein